MLFSVNGVDGSRFTRIISQFGVFKESNGLMPECEIYFHECPKEFLFNKELIKRVGDHSFYRCDDGIMVSNATSFAVMRDSFSKMDVYIPPKFAETQLLFLMLQAYRYSLANAGQFQMHGAVVIYNGFGVVFCGLPGAGKSTQAHLWEKHLNAEPLNLDQPIILFNNDTTLISGSPWSGKEDCYKNIQVPLKAIFFVEKSQNNNVKKLSVAESFSHLYLNNFLLPINEDIDKKHKDAILRLVSDVPVYQLECTISKEAVDVAYNTIFSTEI